MGMTNSDWKQAYNLVCEDRDHMRTARGKAVDRIRELEAEIAVRDNMGNEVLRILREATGKRDFHSEMEAAEWAARMILDLQTQLFLEKQSAKEAMSREAAAVSREIGARAELTEARRDGARVRWYFDQKNSSIVGGLELKWLQQIDCLTYEQWAQDIDAAMTEAQ